MSESERKREKARKSKLASLKNKDKKSKMIGKRENEETVREPGSMETDAQEERLKTKTAYYKRKKEHKDTGLLHNIYFRRTPRHPYSFD